MKIKTLDYVDFDRVNSLLEDFNKLTGFVTAILDLDGNILSQSGWRRICTDFHRVNPGTNKNCLISDTTLANDSINNNFNLYKCKNGLIDVAVPIIIEGEHVANLFTGQFFFEKPNISYFFEQGKKYGFAETPYLEALSEVPIVTEEQVKQTIKYLLNITQIIIDLTTDKIQQENTRMLLESSLESPKDLIILAIDTDYKYLYFNKVHQNSMKYAYNTTAVVGKSLLDCITSEDDMKRAKNNYGKALSGVTHTTLEQFGDLDVKAYETVYSPIKNTIGEIIGASAYAKDVSESFRAARELKHEKELAQTYLNVAGVIILILNIKGEITLINEKGCNIIGLSEKDIIGKNWFDHFLPKDNIEVLKEMFYTTLLKQGELVEEYENYIINAKGEKKYISWHNSLLFDENKNTTGVLCSGEDITEKKKNENALIESNLRFKLLFDKAPLGYQSLDSNGYFREVNETWLNMLGYEKSEVVGKWFGGFLTPKYQQVFKERFEIFKRLGKTHSEFEMIHKSGQRLFIEFEGIVGYNDNRDFEQTHCNLNDITIRHQVQEQLKISELRYRELINNLEAGIIIHRSDTSIASFNKRAEEILGLAYDEMNEALATSDNFRFLGLDYKKLNYEDYPVNLILKNKGPLKNYILGIQHIHDDSLVWVSINGVPLLNEDGSINEVVISVTDISSDKTKQDEITYVSNHDFLTNLYNRRYFVEQYKKLDNHDYFPLGLMMLDVNGLKIINDAFGHDAGDLALKKVANILKNSFREQDIVCRMGGDEFAVILPMVTDEEIEKIKEKIRTQLLKDSVENIVLSVATGYEIKADEHGIASDEMLKLAENHMYKHKLAEGVSVRNNAIKAILQTLTSKFDTERIHSERVSQLCRIMGEELELKEEDQKELELAGMYHDIGKISIPDDILNKPERLTKEEFDIIKTHPEISYQILRAADEYSDLAIHALYHHERWDGKGYPSGKKELEIPLFSRIICVADSYEAMTSIRPYKNKMSKEEALEEVIRCSGTQFDPEIARIFVNLIRTNSI